MSERINRQGNGDLPSRGSEDLVLSWDHESVLFRSTDGVNSAFRAFP